MSTSPTHPAEAGATFEQRLLRELHGYASHSSSSARSPRRVAALAVAGAGAAAVAAGIVLPNLAGTPAYAVEERTDGTIVATVRDWSDPDGFVSALEQHGVEVHLTPATPDGSVSGVEPITDAEADFPSDESSIATAPDAAEAPAVESQPDGSLRLTLPEGTTDLDASYGTLDGDPMLMIIVSE